MRERIRVIIRKEFRQALREPRLRAMLIVPPIVQLLIFGYAVNLDVDSTRIAWMDLDRTPQSRELLDDFGGSGHFQIVALPASESEAQRVLDRGVAQAVVRVQTGFAREVLRGRNAPVQVLVDGTNSNTASLVSGQARQVIGAYSSRKLADWQRDRLVGRTASGPVRAGIPSLTTENRVWFNPDLRSRNYFIPGILVNILVLVTLMLTAMAIVREKEIGTMEQLMVTPIRPLELILGKTLPFAVVGLVDMVLVTAISLTLFRVPFRGSVLLLTGSTILFLLTTLGVGLFISTISQTQQQAMMSSFFFFLPAFMLSGFTFPIRNIPDLARWLTYLNPVRYFVEIVRGIFLKGAGVDVLWPQLLALLALGLSILTLSAMRFKKRLD